MKIISPVVVLACLLFVSSGATGALPHYAKVKDPIGKASTAASKNDPLDALAPMTWFEVPNLAANLHVAAAFPNVDSIEWHMVHRMLFDPATEQTFRQHEGWALLPSEPGLGLRIDPSDQVPQKVR